MAGDVALRAANADDCEAIWRWNFAPDVRARSKRNEAVALADHTAWFVRRLAAERGEIEAAHPLAEGPWLFRRADLDGPAGQAVALRVQKGRPPTAVLDPRSAKPVPANNIARCAL